MASPGSASKRQRTSEYYRVIDGVKYDRSLLTAAEQFAEMGQITLIEAMELWKEAMDGNRVTPTERQTLKYVLAQFSFTEKARNFLEQQLRNARSYYRTINGVKYDRALLDRAESYPEAVTQQQAMELWHHAIDAERLSECGQRSLRYVLRHVKVTGGAKKLLETKLAASDSSLPAGPAEPEPEDPAAPVPAPTQRMSSKRPQSKAARLAASPEPSSAPEPPDPTPTHSSAPTPASPPLAPSAPPALALQALPQPVAPAPAPAAVATPSVPAPAATTPPASVPAAAPTALAPAAAAAAAAPAASAPAVPAAPGSPPSRSVPKLRMSNKRPREAELARPDTMSWDWILSFVGSLLLVLLLRKL